MLSQGAVQLDDSGEAARLVGVSLDITERKQAEAALRESEALFRNLADTAPVMMWTTGPDKLCTFFNKTWLSFTGRTMEQELGHGWAEGIHPDDAERCFAGYCEAFDARRDFHIEYRLRRADGEYRWVLCSGVPRFAPDGVFAGYIGSDIDHHRSQKRPGRGCGTAEAGEPGRVDQRHRPRLQQPAGQRPGGGGTGGVRGLRPARPRLCRSRESRLWRFAPPRLFVNS